VKRTQRKVYFVEDISGIGSTVKIAETPRLLHLLGAHNQHAFAIKVAFALRLAAVPL